MSDNYDDDTETWCGEHAVGRELCGCLHGAQAETRALHLTRASTVKAKQTKWFLDKWIPLGSLTLLAGREGLGKSTLWTMWAAAASRGLLGGSDLDGPRDVLIVANEDAIDFTLVPRLMAAGADLDRVHFLTAVTAAGIQDSVTIPLDGDRLIDVANKTKAGLIVIDPLVSVLDGKLDSHKDHSIRQALDPLNRAAAKTEAAVIGLVHLNKGGSTDVLDRVLGSRAFTAAARSLIALVPDDEDESGAQRLAVHAKSNLGPQQYEALVVELHSVEIETTTGPASVGAMRVTGTRPVDLRDAMTTHQDDDLDDLSDAARWLLDYLSREGGQATRADVIAAGRKSGHSLDQVKRARRRAGVLVHRTPTFPSVTTWLHPDNQPQSVQSVQLEQLVQTPESTAPTASSQSERSWVVPAPSAPSAPTAPTGAADYDPWVDEEDAS